MAETQLAARRFPPSVSVTMPVGTIVAHYDFNGLVALPAEWMYCDGATVSDIDSPINGQVLPDLSNRYLVGFGTEAGNDIDTAAWATAAVGNASHSVALVTHTHDVNIGAFSISGGAHSHNLSAAGWVQANMDVGTNEIQVHFHTVSAWTANFSGLFGGGITSSATGESVTSAWDLDGATDSSASHSHTVDPPNTTSTGPSAASQNIQPRSIRVRWIMRIK